MKVNTDGVLLGAWAKIRPLDKTILDIGTGTGVIALMMAQRAPEAFITAVEIDEESSIEAEMNFSTSKWANRLKIENYSIQEFAKTNQSSKFDLIITNPPYFDQSLKSNKERKSIARHSDCGLT
ncbi:MAG: methyltransferase, partial [Bacteroidales bacterium]